MSVEKIKFGTHQFDLVPNGVQLSDNGGKILFEQGESTFEAIKLILKANEDIEQINTAGETDWSRSDLIYGGRLMVIDDYEVSEGITKDVMQAEFKTPDVKTLLDATNANLYYLAMMTDISLEEI
jgi:hypothetical protein